MNWHTRFEQQARWTQSMRHYLYGRYNISNAGSILDVGCGTGVLLSELPDFTGATRFGIDINRQHLEMSARNNRGACCSQADAFHLPFPNQTFDIVLCHFVLLWLADPLAAILEMQRVTRPGGCILALAEPDYGCRLDYPDELSKLGSWQQASLRQQGADPLIGRKLAHLFYQAGLQDIETGLLGAQWRPNTDLQAFELEWQVLLQDLQNDPGWLSTALQLRESDRRATSQGWRILFVPTFYLAATLKAQPSYK